jgi:hypothetical protein
VKRSSGFVDPIGVTPNACRDPDDLPVLGAAIVSPRRFLELDAKRGIVDEE